MTTVLESLNLALHRSFAADQRVYLLGEDVLDPYGGAFKVTRGLSMGYPGRVLTTPISEAGIVGVSAGMALRGLRPVVEIMFGDFLTLAADQLVNHVAKFTWMYNGQVQVPIVIRTPMGGRRGYGPTHSQTLEKLFMGVPGLTVLAPAALSGSNALGDPGDLLYAAILETNDPVLFIENKLLYLLPVLSPAELPEFNLALSDSSPAPGKVFTLSIRGAPPAQLTIAAYGYMADLARQAILRLAYEAEIFAELIVPTRLSPICSESLTNSVRQTGTLLTVEEGTLTLGWGAEVLARTAEALPSNNLRLQRLAAQETPVPASGPLEAQALPGVESIFQAARELIAQR